METADNNLDVFLSILQKYNIPGIGSMLKENGWNSVLQELECQCSKETFESDVEKHIFVDLYCHQCLKYVDPATERRLFLNIIDKWYQNRQPQNRCGHLVQEEKIALIHFCVKLRSSLLNFLTEPGLTKFDFLTDDDERLLIAVWRQIFFEPFSALCLYWNPTQEEQNTVLIKCRENGYLGFVAASMYRPFDADDYAINAYALVQTALPFCFKTIICFWMVNTPYFHGTEKHRQKLMRYVPALCSALLNQSQSITTLFFFTFVQEVMTGLWRASYIGGNNLKALAAFGDFISVIMQKVFPFPYPQPRAKNLAAGEKIRIGYISRNFYKQAVSCYMVNRIIYHDRDKFDVCIFALGDYHDEISDLYQQNCSHFERITSLTDLKAIAQTIVDQKLDILIYPDIGMDPVTYMLSGLQLAPVQCALVGHGTSTGMPTIQYYLSGDFESSCAQEHYRETLIRLPKLGAAQYLPMKPENKVTRAELGIPDDAVVFISCANGLKHGKSRYPVFVEFLKQAPNAWILLKPYAHPSSIDYNFAGEILTLAYDAGVADRLKILPPVGEAKYVLGLLRIADVQLDSYPYGGWTTNLEALYMGLPIVTQEGELARSRWGAGMLKALGIREGIAFCDEDYVTWAVRFAQDRDLLKKLKNRIKKRVRKNFFNGKAAQKSYEDTITQIYLESCHFGSKRQAKVKSAISLLPKLVTSLAPGDSGNQRQAMQTWLNAGFKVVSINAIDEIARLKSFFPGIDFVAAFRDGRTKYGKPYIYFDDILTYFKYRQDQICGIVNSDIYLNEAKMLDIIQQEAKGSFVFGSRVDVACLDTCHGQEYGQGFDYFFFDRKVLDYYPPQEQLCLGLPWWDYWAVVVPLMNGVDVKRLVTPAVQHIKHAANWNRELWFSLGQDIAKHFRPPFDLTVQTMVRYADETTAIIKKLSREIAGWDPAE